MITDPPKGAGMSLVQATEAIMNELKRADNNQDFLETLTK
jgi:transcription termination factor Rho